MIEGERKRERERERRERERREWAEGRGGARFHAIYRNKNSEEERIGECSVTLYIHIFTADIAALPRR